MPWAVYGVCRERLLTEQHNYNLLFLWFVGMNIDDYDAGDNFRDLLRSNQTCASITHQDA